MICPEVPDLKTYLADPSVYVAGEVCYLIASHESQDGRRLPIYRSTDLRNWTFVRGAVAQGAENAWNRRNFWAPEVFHLDGRFYVYYTAMPDGTPGNTGNRVGAAVSDHPGGPFDDLGVVVPHGSIDGSVFTDTDDSRFMLYTTEHGSTAGYPRGRILIDRLLTPTRVGDEPIELINNHGWQEGASLVKRDDRYYLFFSTGNWQADDYCVRWAVADKPDGPYTQPEVAPLISTFGDMIGPGHGFPWCGQGDRWYYTFHAWDPEMTRRSPRFASLAWHDGVPRCAPIQ